MAKTGMTKAQVIEWAERHGWTMDRYGHMQKTRIGKDGRPHEYRLKLQSTSFRHEIRLHFPAGEYAPVHNEWTRLGGGYYKDVYLTDDDKLHVR